MGSDDVSRPAGTSVNVAGAQHFFARAMHIFFGRPLRFLLPAILLTALGAYSATSKPDQYVSAGVLSVSSETFLGELSQVRASQTTYETPATAIARQFNELMQTDKFAETVAAGAGLTITPGPQHVDVAAIRGNVYTSATGNSLLRIIAMADDPQRAQALAGAGTDAYKNYVISSEVLGSDVAESFYDDQLATHKAEVDAANQALDDYVADHPEPIDARDERDVADQLEIERLNALLEKAQERYDLAFDNRERSSLATMQSEADSGQRFRVLDAPQVPVVPISGLKDTLTTVIMYAVLGLMVSFGAVVIACVLDRSIHSATDLERLGITVRAVVPKTRMRKNNSPRHQSAMTAPIQEPMRSAG